MPNAQVVALLAAVLAANAALADPQTAKVTVPMIKLQAHPGAVRTPLRAPPKKTQVIPIPPGLHKQFLEAAATAAKVTPPASPPAPLLSFSLISSPSTFNLTTMSAIVTDNMQVLHGGQINVELFNDVAPVASDRKNVFQMGIGSVVPSKVYLLECTGAGMNVTAASFLDSQAVSFYVCIHSVSTPFACQTIPGAVMGHGWRAFATAFSSPDDDVQVAIRQGGAPIFLMDTCSVTPMN